MRLPDEPDAPTRDVRRWLRTGLALWLALVAVGCATGTGEVAVAEDAPYATGDLNGGEAYRTFSLDPELRFAIPADHGERSWEVWTDESSRFALFAQVPDDANPDGPPSEIGQFQIVPVDGDSSTDEVFDTVMAFADDTPELRLEQETAQLGGADVPVLRGRVVAFRPLEVPLPNDGLFLATPGRNIISVIEGASQLFVIIVDGSESDIDLVLERSREVLQTIEFP